ncbi:phosphatase 6 regulatory subunit 1-like protein fmt isoform X2 [Calliopsis andreniformis]|uniref:phosphatase 6 regulatory subunit 1-like protein fmt isoform X2 n=1 Tax=Calliopsis andreniformis TaxID=337506 RepID=UPI003FCE4D7D
MFWANNYVSSPHIEQLLNKEDVTLHEVMDDEDILQECKSQNKKLVEYLTRSDVMEELITLITEEPPMDMDERLRYKYPNIACELLTCNVLAMNEKLAGDDTLLAKLYSFIDTDQPLNPLLASFFSKTIGVLVARKADQNWYSYQFTCLQVLEFLKSRQTCVDLLLQHLETSAIMDLVLKLVTQVEGNDMRQNILNWLDSQQLVQRLVKLLSPNSEPNKHTNAAQLLFEMIVVTRRNQRTSTDRTDPDPILNTLESEETVTLLLETILSGEKVESGITGGIQVLLKLLGKKANNALNEGDDSSIGEEVVDDKQLKISNAILPYLEQLHKLLIDPPYKPPVKTTTGVLECPLGYTRIHVARLFTTLMATDNVKIYETLIELGTIQTLVDLFFKYTWNNFLHTQVQLCLALAINCDFKDIKDIIYDTVFIKCRLIERILEAWDKNDSKQNPENRIRQGYMGHLINIAKDINDKQCKEGEGLDKFLEANLSPECLNKWKNFVNTELAKIRKLYAPTGGSNTEFANMSSDNPDEFNSHPQDKFLQEQRVQQFYSNYLEENMAPQLTENFGFYDNKFNNDGDLHEEDHEEREDMFNKICQEKQKAGLDDCSAGVEWGDEGELTFQTVVDKQDWPMKQQNNDSNSSDEDEAWNATEPLSTVTALPEVNPWDSVPSEPVEILEWANFDNFDNVPDMNDTSSTVIIDNKLRDEMKKETSDIIPDINKMETVAGNKVMVDTIGADDVKVKDSVDSTSSQIEENINPIEANHKSTEDDSHSVCTTEKNTSPNEILNSRETTCGENIINTELATATVQNEKPLNDHKVSCSLKITPSETILPQTDAK